MNNVGHLDDADRCLLDLIDEQFDPDRHNRVVGGLRLDDLEHEDLPDSRQAVRNRLYNLADRGFIERANSARSPLAVTYLPVDDADPVCVECETRVGSKTHPKRGCDDPVCLVCHDDLKVKLATTPRAGGDA